MQHILSHLLRAGVLDEEKLHAVRQRRRRSAEPLVASLVALGFLTEEQVMRTLIELTGLEVTSLEPEDVDERLLVRVSLHLMRRTGTVPLRLDDEGHALVATCDPYEVLGQDELRTVLRRPLRLLLAPWSAVRALLDARVSAHDTLAEGVVGELLASGVSTGLILQDDVEPQDAKDAEEPPPGALVRPPEEDEARSPASASAPMVRLADLILADALGQGVSDIHIEPLAGEVRLRFRLSGVLRTIRSLPREIGPALVARLKIMARLDITVRRQPQDGRLWFRSDADGRVIDVRLSTLPTVEGEKVVMRLLDPRSVDHALPDMLAPADLPRWLSIVERTQGLVLVTGPTGSGKTTTLYATLRHLLTEEQNFVTIEEPVEYHIDGVAQVNVRQVDGTSFAKTLRAILRQDPDVILVGEIRDGETAATALQAATTGHLVLSTLHTNDAASACTRLVDLGGAPFLLADALAGVLAQRLIRRLCTACRLPYTAGEEEVARVGAAVRGTTLYRAAGCPACAAGFSGRVAVQEIAPTSAAVRELILAGGGDGAIRELYRQSGVPSMFASGLAYALGGLTSLEELARRVPQDEVERARGCGACGAVVPPEASFCVTCGARARARCACGAALDARWSYCGACGAAAPGASAG